LRIILPARHWPGLTTLIGHLPGVGIQLPLPLLGFHLLLRERNALQRLVHLGGIDHFAAQHRRADHCRRCWQGGGPRLAGSLLYLLPADGAGVPCQPSIVVYPGEHVGMWFPGGLDAEGKAAIIAIEGADNGFVDHRGWFVSLDDGRSARPLNKRRIAAVAVQAIRGNDNRAVEVTVLANVDADH